MVSSATLWNRRGLPRLGTAMATAPLALQGLGGGDGDLAQAARAENVTTEPRAAPRRRQESPAMRIVGVEEHFVFSDLLARVAPNRPVTKIRSPARAPDLSTGRYPRHSPSNATLRKRSRARVVSPPTRFTPYLFAIRSMPR